MMIFLGLSWACSEDEDNHLPVIEPEDSGVFTDAEGREFSWVRYGNLEWMTTNLNIEASYGYEISHERTRLARVGKSNGHVGKRVKYDRLARSFRGRTIATSGRDQDQPPHGRNGRI